MYTLPQGVFSETLNYIEGAKIRPENFCPTNQNKLSGWWDGEVVKNLRN